MCCLFLYGVWDLSIKQKIVQIGCTQLCFAPPVFLSSLSNTKTFTLQGTNEEKHKLYPFRRLLVPYSVVLGMVTPFLPSTNTWPATVAVVIDLQT